MQGWVRGDRILRSFFSSSYPRNGVASSRPGLGQGTCRADGGHCGGRGVSGYGEFDVGRKWRDTLWWALPAERDGIDEFGMERVGARAENAWATLLGRCAWDRL